MDEAIVYYRLPGSTEVVRLQGPVTAIDYQSADLGALEGFIVHSFSNQPSFLIEPSGITRFPSDAFSAVSANDPAYALSPGNSNRYIDREEYLSQLDPFKSEMVLDGIQKAIFSRVKRWDQVVDVARTFANLIRSYPTAFCYLVSSPETGTWVGATPEKLFNQDTNGDIYIHSLAGTRPVTDSNWTDKELEEQELVTRYISNQLSENGFTGFTTGETETISAGPVVSSVRSAGNPGITCL
ncbi:MAG: chorismate-binding protein [Bacteroidota bacterium]